MSAAATVTHIFELLDKLANLLNHLGHEDDVHLVREVGSVDRADQQAPSPGHHVALVQSHLTEGWKERKISVCLS